MTNPKILGLVLGPIIFFIVIAIPSPDDLPDEAKVILAIALWMIIWWITEAISVYATALLPLALIPITGVASLNEVATEYMHPIVVLLLGMFLIAIAVERSGLHKQIAFALISVFGYSPKKIIWGFMIATALISTVIMSTTAVLIMLPIAFVVLNSLSKSTVSIGRNFHIALMLGIAYSSSIGSVATLIGAPPNLIYSGTVRELFEHSVSFAEWSILGAPLSVIMLLIAGLYMTRHITTEKVHSSSMEQTIKDILLIEKQKVSRFTAEQVTVLIVMVGVLSLMFTTPLWLPTETFITNSVIAIVGGISLFVLPKSRSESLLDWAGVEKLPFGVLFLLGGGLALSQAFISSGLADWLASLLSVINILPFGIVVVVLVGIVMSMSNVKSNTAAAAVFIPVIGNMAILNGWSPLPILFGITIATSFAFLLPMGTPPNALVYERGKITVKEMLQKGVVLNIIAITLITIFTIFISPILLP
jgi:solute carrier family 13 (sodium-dependent dicarboxylate transporter), member 2/3/5